MAMKDMALTSEEQKENMPVAMPEISQPRYPYGLSICLTEKELKKLDLDSECEVGDLIHLHCMAKVTSRSENETTNGNSCRIELQIVAMEAEDEENEEEYQRPLGRKRPY